MQNRRYKNEIITYTVGRVIQVDSSPALVHITTYVKHFNLKPDSESLIFDSAIAPGLLQGLYPANPKNKITLANESTVTGHRSSRWIPIRPPGLMQGMFHHVLASRLGLVD